MIAIKKTPTRPKIVFGLVIVAAILAMLPTRAGAQTIPPVGEPSIRWDVSEADFDAPTELQDSSGNGDDGTLYSLIELSEPILDSEDSGVTTYMIFDGFRYVSSTIQQLPPSEFVIEVEFRSFSNEGKLAGFEDTQTGLGTFSDRMLYIGGDGRLYFGGASGTSVAVPSLEPVTDEAWHTATGVARIANSAINYELYLDGEFQGSIEGRNISSYPGYWRLGGGNTNGWLGADGDFFIGETGTEENFKASAAAYQVLHLAMHGEADYENPLHSKLIFSA